MANNMPNKFRRGPAGLMIRILIAASADIEFMNRGLIALV